MNRQINLVSHKKKNVFNRDRLLHGAQYISRFSIVFVVVSAIGLFIVNRSGTLPILEQQDKTFTTNLTYVQQKIIKFLLIRERLHNVDPLLNNGSRIDTILTQISSALPNGVNLDNLSLSDKKFSLTISSASLTSLSTFLDFAINKVNQKDVFKTITISNFSADAGAGKYSVNLDITTYE